MPFDLEIPLLGIYLMNIVTNYTNIIHISMFIPELCVITLILPAFPTKNTWELPKCPFIIKGELVKYTLIKP